MSCEFSLIISNEIPLPSPPWIGDRPVDFNLGYQSACPQRFAEYAELKRTVQHAYSELRGQDAVVGDANYISGLPKGFWQRYRKLCLPRAQVDSMPSAVWWDWVMDVWGLYSEVTMWSGELHALGAQLTSSISDPDVDPPLRDVFAHLNAFRLHLLTFAEEKLQIEQLCAFAMTDRIGEDLAGARKILVSAKMFIDHTLGAHIKTACRKHRWSAAEYPAPAGFPERCWDLQALFRLDGHVGRTSLGLEWARWKSETPADTDADGTIVSDFSRLNILYFMLKRHVELVMDIWKNDCGGPADGTLDGSSSSSGGSSVAELPGCVWKHQRKRLNCYPARYAGSSSSSSGSGGDIFVETGYEF